MLPSTKYDFGTVNISIIVRATIVNPEI